MNIEPSELILNPDGSIYHLNLKPQHIATNIICVGDQDRVDKVTQHFDFIEFTTQKREFKTVTGVYKNKKLTVISTGIGSDNIDIVLNELDALVNINLKTRQLKSKHTSLNIIRIGTSGALQKEIPIDCFLISSYALDINGMLHSYQTENISNPDIEKAFINQTHWNKKKSTPLIISSNTFLEEKLYSKQMYKGITATAGGFYGPQGRVLRLPLQEPNMNIKFRDFHHKKLKITNLEMETSAIYGLSKLLGHKACSLNAIIANRANKTFSEHPEKTIDSLITYTLDKLVE